jgi:hypothetical protein
VTCPECQQAAPFHGHRPFRPVSLLGPITCSRAYYYCGRCGLGLFPFDEQAGFHDHRLTAGAERVVCLLGQVCDSFAEAAHKALPEACGLHLGEATVQRATEDAGRRLGELLQDGHTLGDPAAFTWHPDAQGRTCAYVGVDAIGVPQQAPGGGQAENRMSYVAMAILRALVKSAADKDPSALTLLLGMLPAVDALLADVQAALGQWN